MKTKTCELITHSAEVTQSVGNRLGLRIHAPMTIELISDLGGGKTTFVQGLAEGLGYRGIVTSPTFTINRSYPLKSETRLEHFDLYRLAGLGVVASELAEAMADESAITAVEWPETANVLMPKDRLILRIEPKGESSRALIFEATGDRSAKIIEDFA